MPNYSADGQAANTASTSIMGVDAGATPRRVKVYDLILGSDATPADNAAEYNLSRYTGDGTPGSVVVPKPLDFADPVALADAGEGVYTIEPVYTADEIMLNWSQNQRATFRWVAAPGGEIICPATTDSGVGIESITVAGAAVNTTATMHFNE